MANIFFHPSVRGLWYQPWWISKKGRELIAAHRHDVMTVHEYPPFYNGIGAMMLRRATKVPFMLEVHHIVGSPRAASFFEWCGRILSWLLLPFEARSAAAVRVVSNETGKTLQWWGIPHNKISLLPSAYLDAEVLTPDPSVQKKYDVVCCGRFVGNKGLAEILQVMTPMPHVSLLLIGDGPLRGKLERLVHHLHIADRVTFAGWLPTNEAVYHALQAAKIFVMNSTSEGGPRVALEAMALGLPVITTKVGVMPEVISDGVNGLFTTGESVDLSAKIRKLLDNDALRAKMGTESQKILQQFERRNLIQQYANFLQSLSLKPNS